MSGAPEARPNPDWIIVPVPGHHGGRILFASAPAELAAARSTLTGEHLPANLEARPVKSPDHERSRTGDGEARSEIADPRLLNG